MARGRRRCRRRDREELRHGVPAQPLPELPRPAREALEFYQGVFGGELTINTFGEFGMEGEPRPSGSCTAS